MPTLEEVEALYRAWVADYEGVLADGEVGVIRSEVGRFAFFAGWQRGYERGHAEGGRLHTPGRDPWTE
jgi:hypothetical protein